VFFLFDSDRPDNLGDVEDVCFELDVLVDGNVRIVPSVHVGDQDQWEGNTTALVEKRSTSSKCQRTPLLLPEEW
jgi:hypothetical protein